MKALDLREITDKIQQKRELTLQSNAIRLINGEGDRFPGWTLDQFDRHFQLQIFDGEVVPQINQLASSLCDALNSEYFTIKYRTEKTGAALEHLNTKVLTPNANPETWVDEGGLLFKMNLEEAVNSGLFLDMRRHRLQMREHCRGAKVLNGFSYTCSFGLHARRGGAAYVANVDINKKILDWGKENYLKNGFDSKDFVKENTLQFLDFCAKKGHLFDVIVMDPPTFSRYKGKAFHVRKQLEVLVEKCLKILNFQGVFLFSSNCSQLSRAEIIERTELQMKEKGRKPEKLFLVQQDQDFSPSPDSATSHLVGACWRVF